MLYKYEDKVKGEDKEKEIEYCSSPSLSRVININMITGIWKKFGQ